MAKIKTFEGKEVDMPAFKVCDWAKGELKKVDEVIEDLNTKIKAAKKYQRYLAGEAGFELSKGEDEKKTSGQTSKEA